jgi:hypothetical protein
MDGIRGRCGSGHRARSRSRMADAHSYLQTSIASLPRADDGMTSPATEQDLQCPSAGWKGSASGDPSRGSPLYEVSGAVGAAARTGTRLTSAAVDGQGL